jgi:hypothetical protein
MTNYPKIFGKEILPTLSQHHGFSGISKWHMLIYAVFLNKVDFARIVLRLVRSKTIVIILLNFTMDLNVHTVINTDPQFFHEI